MTSSGYLTWTLYLFAVLAFFAILEYRGWRSGNTLSRYVATIGQKWPLSIFLWGLLVGGLAVHFFWHWGCDISLQGG